MNEKTFKVNGKGTLSLDNVKSVCEHGNNDDLTLLGSKISYAIEATQTEIDKKELGFELLGVDFTTLEKNLEALKSVNASKKEIKKVIGVKYDELQKYIGKKSYLNYLTYIRDMVDEAMG